MGETSKLKNPLEDSQTRLGSAKEATMALPKNTINPALEDTWR